MAAVYIVNFVPLGLPSRVRTVLRPRGHDATVHHTIGHQFDRIPPDRLNRFLRHVFAWSERTLTCPVKQLSTIDVANTCKDRLVH